MNWIRASVALATFGFITLVLFLAFSGPFNNLVNTLSDESNETLNNSGKAMYFYDMIKTVFGVVFVLAFTGLITWFLLGSHKEEYEEY